MQQSGIAVFDIGGTWFRCGIYKEATGLEQLSKTSALNYKNTAHDNPLELQLKLVEYLATQMKAFQDSDNKITAASISMGAALNGHTGEILNSGPLWGPHCETFDLLGHLRKQMPEVDWFVLNDVSAALLRYAHEPQYASARRTTLITISSGIACRTFDRASRDIPLNKDGLQGEIGHIPIHFSLFGEYITKTCDCGGENHLNAFSSGRGITTVLRHFISSEIPSYEHADLRQQLRAAKSDDELMRAFVDAVNAGGTAAQSVLDALTYPVAEMIVHLLTIDAEVEKIIMTGGVVHSTEAYYIKSLLANLKKIGLYQMSDLDAFFKQTITVGADDDNSGLLGAAIAYGNKTNEAI